MRDASPVSEGLQAERHHRLGWLWQQGYWGMSSSSGRRIDIYKHLGVPEIWRYMGGSVQIYRRQDREYVPSDRSPSFPLVSAIIINQCLQQAETQDDTTFIRTWRQWVRQ